MNGTAGIALGRDDEGDGVEAVRVSSFPLVLAVGWAVPGQAGPFPARVLAVSQASHRSSSDEQQNIALTFVLAGGASLALRRRRRRIRRRGGVFGLSGVAGPVSSTEVLPRATDRGY